MEVNPTDVRADATSRLHRADVPPGRAAEGAQLHASTSSRRCRRRIYTDGQRLQQVLKNLLSNAFKFTEQGGVTLTIRKAEKRQALREPHARHARTR